jgi:ATP-dependent Lon protease
VTAARITRVERLQRGGYIAIVEGVARIRIDRYTKLGFPYFEAEVTVFAEQGPFFS